MHLSRLTDVLLDIPQSFLDRSAKPSQSPDRNQPASGESVDRPSTSPSFYCPSGAFQGWKQVELAGKRQSKSSSDLKSLTSLRDQWVWDPRNAQNVSDMDVRASAARGVGLEDMPFEILGTVMPEPLSCISYIANCSIRHDSLLPHARPISRVLRPTQRRSHRLLDDFAVTACCHLERFI